MCPSCCVEEEKLFWVIDQEDRECSIWTKRKDVLLETATIWLVVEGHNSEPCAENSGKGSRF